MTTEKESIKIILTALYCSCGGFRCEDCPSSIDGRCEDRGGSLEDAIRFIRNKYNV